MWRLKSNTTSNSKFALNIRGYYVRVRSSTSRYIRRIFLLALHFNDVNSAIRKYILPNFFYLIFTLYRKKYIMQIVKHLNMLYVCENKIYFLL